MGAQQALGKSGNVQQQSTRFNRPEGERVLLWQFHELLKAIFEHGSAFRDSTLADLMIMHAFDDVNAAGLLAEAEFGAGPAGEMCRRACCLRRFSMELTEFFEASGQADREALPTIQRARRLAELSDKNLLEVVL